MLKHPRIVRYMYIIEPPGYNDVHILMEYMHLGSLKKYIEKNGEMDEELVKAYTKQILEGLDFLHSKNIIHRDLKPANLLIGNTHDERIIKIGDFGSSKFAYLRTKAGQQGRTPKYTDPAVSLGREIAGRRSDIWSLGVIVIEMYTGLYPWAIDGEHPLTVPHILEEKEPRIVVSENRAYRWSQIFRRQQSRPIKHSSIWPKWCYSQLPPGRTLALFLNSQCSKSPTMMTSSKPISLRPIRDICSSHLNALPIQF